MKENIKQNTVKETKCGCQCEENKKDKFLEELCNKYQPIKDNLIQILNEVQEHYGYIPMNAQEVLSRFLDIPMAEIYGVVTFYSRFTLKPKGKYNISVCLGTACFVKGSQKIMDRLKERLNIEVGETIEEEVTPKDFGRVAAATAKQVVVQKIREAERNTILNEYQDKQDELVSGIVEMEDARNYYIGLGKTQGILPKTEIIPGETIKMGSNIKVYITKVESNSKGPIILLSRCHYGFVKRLLELEIPEINEGIILVYSVAREAGVRTKVAVYSENAKVDPIGACIGEKGMRIANILKELNGEKIDIIEYSKDSQQFIKNALSPAKDPHVFITDEKKNEALVVVDKENFSLAIGKKGLNVKLASRLTHFKIDVKTYEQAKEEGINIIG